MSSSTAAIPGLLAFRVEASLLYFNVDFVRDAILQHATAAAAPVHAVVLDLSSL